MSLNSALNAAVSGLTAQSAAISAVAENIANASTTAYKVRGISFQALVTNTSAGTSSNQVGGGVIFGTRQDMEQQGLIQNTGVSTNIAINGQGFFVVTDDANNQPSAFQYSRNGDFRTNEQGQLVNNEGMILLGQRTDEGGVVTAANSSDLNSLTPIDLNTISGTAQATTRVEMDMNIPANSATAPAANSSYSNAFEIFDELGVSHTIQATFTKTGPNAWRVAYQDPVLTTDLQTLGAAAPASGAVDLNPAVAGAQSTIELVFNGNGSIDTIDIDPVSAGGAGSISNAAPLDVDFTFTNGANPLTVATGNAISLDLGTHDLFDGLTQFSANTATPQIEISTIDQDGVRFGQLSGVEIDDEGIVTATFDNGVRRPIYQIPIATFPNPAGLTNINGTVYDENERAGNMNLRLPGQGNSGVIEAVSLEQSATDTSKEFNKMIVAQQAYSSAAQVVSTSDEMFETLIGAVR